MNSTLKIPPLSLQDLASATGVPRADLARQAGTAALLSLPGGKRGILPEAARAALLAAGLRLPEHSPMAFMNLKGGVGKTTLTVNLAVRAAQYGLRCCVVDLDPQASSTLALSGEPAEETPVFLDIWQKPAEQLPAALLAVHPLLDLLPSSLDNTLLDAHLAHPAQQRKAVAGVCERLNQLGYDLILIDCPPALGTAVISTLCATRQVVIPLCADAFSLKGLRLTLEEMTAIGETFHLPPPRSRVLFNRYDKRERVHNAAYAYLREHHGAQLMATAIHTSSQYSRALHARQSIFSEPRQTIASQDCDACLRELLDLQPPPTAPGAT